MSGGVSVLSIGVGVVAAALAGGLVACAGILGIDDRTLATSGDGGGGGDGGAGCSADPCPMASNLNHPFALAADDTNVYWTEYGSSGDENGAVKSCPVAGCGSGPTVYAELQASPRGLAVDRQNVYWGTASSSAATGAIWSCPLAGCAGQPTKVAAADTPFGLAVDATAVYWAEFLLGTVNRAPKGGGSPVAIWDGGSGTGGINGPSELAVDPTFVYVSDQNAAVYRVPAGGGNLVPMYTDMNATPVGVFGIAVDVKDVYIGDLGGIFQMGRLATSGATGLVPNLTDVTDLKLDPAGGVLYWADIGSNGTDGTVGKIALGGGSPVLLHQSLVTPGVVAVDATYVFWASNGRQNADGTTADGTGTLYRSAK